MERKKEYSKPQLDVIGTIQEITQGLAKYYGTADLRGSEGPPPG